MLVKWRAGLRDRRQRLEVKRVLHIFKAGATQLHGDLPAAPIDTNAHFRRTRFSLVTCVMKRCGATLRPESA